MLVSQRHKVAFVHIPKCGGSTIRQQFSDISDLDTDFSGPYQHPQLGHVRFGHLPLWALREHHPDAFESLIQCRIHALSRDVFDRFESAVSQYLYHRENRRITTFSTDDVLAVSHDIIENIRDVEKLVSLKYCHFIRQSDFIFLDGERVVEAVYPLSDIDRLVADLSCATGIQSSATLHSNQTLDFKIKGSEKALRRLSGVSKRLLPLGLHSHLKKIGKNIATQKGNKHKGFSRKDREISDFINAYYEQDISLFESVSATSKR